MSDTLMRILAFLPWGSLFLANCKIGKRIKKLAETGDDALLDYMSGYRDLQVAEIEKLYAQTLSIKGTLEGKLQAFLFSVAIGVTVLTSSLAFLYGSAFAHYSLFVKVCVVSLLGVVILLMLLGGYFAIRTIGKQISIYTQGPLDLAAPREEYMRILAINTELNSLTNILRSNYMHASLHCILNAISGVFVFFLVVSCLALGSRPTTLAQSVDVRIQPLSSDVTNLQATLVQHIGEQVQIDKETASALSSIATDVAMTSNRVVDILSGVTSVTNTLQMLTVRLLDLETHRNSVSNGVSCQDPAGVKVSP